MSKPAPTQLYDHSVNPYTIYPDAVMRTMTPSNLGWLARWHGDSAIRRMAGHLLGKISGGAPKGRGAKYRPCEWCGGVYSAREMRRHKPRCGKALDAMLDKKRPERLNNA